MRWTPFFLALVFAAAALAASGCGDSASVDKDPATALIEGAGYEICSEDERTGQFSDYEGLVESRIFLVAESCEGEKSDDTVIFASFNSSQNAQKAAVEFEKTYPGAETFREKGITMSVNGPNAKTIAATLRQQVASPVETTDS